MKGVTITLSHEVSDAIIRNARMPTRDEGEHAWSEYVRFMTETKPEMPTNMVNWQGQIAAHKRDGWIDAWIAAETKARLCRIAEAITG